MGRKKVVLRTRGSVDYARYHLLSLPYEILLQVLDQIKDDIRALLNLSLSCFKLNTIINKTYLYKNLTFKNPYQFSKFSQYHLPIVKSSFSRKLGLDESSSKINYIQSVHLINPPPKDSSNYKTSIAGSYGVETNHRTDNQLNYSHFIQSFISLLNEAFGLKTIQISEISPHFTFPDEITNNDHNYLTRHIKRPKPKRVLPNLILKGQTGWTLPFKVSHISSIINIYDTIENLSLYNFVINESKLIEYSIQKPISIITLTLNACLFLDSSSKKQNCKRIAPDVFSQTSCLQLFNIQTVQDLSAIDFVKLNSKLLCIVIDFDSKIFFEFNSQDKHFNFSRYNNFFKLICSGQGGYSTLQEIVLLNFDLFDCYGHIHNIREPTLDEQDDNWIETPTDKFHQLLSHLSRSKNLTIILKETESVVHKCVKCGFTTGDRDDPFSDVKTIGTLNRTEWSILLDPLLSGNKKCNVKILDHSLNSVYTRLSDQ